MKPLEPAPPPGLYRGIPFSVYCRWEAVSRSELVELARSPAHYRYAKYERPEPEAPAWIGTTDYLALGQAIHDAVLLSEHFEARYAIGPDCKLTTKEGKAAWSAFAEEYAGKLLLRADAGAICLAIRDAVWSSPVARDLLAGAGESELSASFERDGIACKARPDRYIPDAPRGPVLLDLKSAADADPRAWMRDAVRRRLHYQTAWYCDGMTLATGIEHAPEDFLFCVYEKEPPYSCSVHRFDADAVEQARSEIAALLEILRKCQAANEWPDYSHVINTISLPAWARLGPETALLLGA